MRILHVIPSLDPADGGPPKIAARLAAAQAGLGHDVVMARENEPAVQDVVDRELRSIPFADRVQYRDAAEIENLLPQTDFAHFHSLWSPLTKSTAAAAREKNVPYTILLNGMLDPYSLSQKKLKKKIALLLGYRSMLNHAAFLHTGNADEVRLIEPLHLSPPRRTIPNGVFLEEISPLPPAGSFYAKHPELNHRPFILFLARLHHKKGLDYLADAFALAAAKLPEVQLVVAGPDGGMRQEFVDRIAAAKLSDRVHVVGPIYDRDRLEAMADAACFCLPSRQEGFSLAITEALGCGLPAVISENCHFPEVAQVGAGLVLPLDAQVFADGLVKVMSDANLRAQMSAAGSKLVREKYTWPVIAEQTIAAYKEFAR